MLSHNYLLQPSASANPNYNHLRPCPIGTYLPNLGTYFAYLTARHPVCFLPLYQLHMCLSLKVTMPMSELFEVAEKEA